MFLGFSLTLASFGTIALYALTDGNLALTVRIASLLLALPHLRGFLTSRAGPLWPDERQRKFTIAVLLVLMVVTLGNVIVGGLGYLQLLMLTALIGPVSIFYNTIRDATHGELVDPEPKDVDAG